MDENQDKIMITPAEEPDGDGAPSAAELGEEGASAPAEQASETPAVPPEEPDLKYKNGKEVAKGGLLGFFIGLAVIVPGVSGSTVAIIFKLYHKLLYALGNIVRKFKKCAKFLVPILIGLIVGFVLGFLAIQRLIDISPFTIIGLFAGLMLGAFPAVYDEVRAEKKTPLRIGLFAVGLAIPVVISVVSVFATEGAQSLDGLNAGHYILFLVLGCLKRRGSSTVRCHCRTQALLLFEGEKGSVLYSPLLRRRSQDS